MASSVSIEARVEDLCVRGNIEVEKDAFDRAKRLYEDALRLGEKTMDSEMRVGVREALAECYSRLKDFKKAADCNREALRLLETEWKDTYGPRHSLTIKARNDLASNLADLSDQPHSPVGALQEAVDLRTKNVEILKSQKRPKTLANAQQKLALDVAKLARSEPTGARTDELLAQPASLYEQTFAAWKAQNEPVDSQRFIKARYNYGTVLCELGKYDEAKKVFLENQAILDGMPEIKKKTLVTLERNQDRYLAVCIEKTSDLSLGISRRPTGSLEDKKDDSKSESKHSKPPTPSLRVDSPERPSKSSDTSRERSRHRESAPSIPGAFPDTNADDETTNGRLSPALVVDARPKRSKSDPKQVSSRISNVDDVRPKSDEERPSKKKDAVAKADTNDAKSKPESKKHEVSSSKANERAEKQSGKDSPTLVLRKPKPVRESNTASQSHLGQEPSKDRLEPKKGTRSDSANENETTDVDDKSEVSSAVYNGELFSIPATANDADIWMIRMRKYAHTLLKYRDSSFNRKRVRVAIIDSGVKHGSDRHSSRADIWRQRHRFRDFKDFTGDNADWTDSSKACHGTNCASLLLQVAPEADLYIANVVRPGQDGIEPKHAAEALKWAINDRKVDIISMSLGWEDWKHQVAEQINEARQKHILVFAAASNDGRLKPDYGVYPAWEPTVFCINASSGSGKKWDRNPLHSDDKVNLMFLGEDVCILDSKNKPEFPNEERLTGTSFAAPIAAATAALVIDLVRWQVSNIPKVERCLKTYEGMSAVFQAMSGKPTKDGYYHVMPWNMLGKDKKPISLVGANESDEWYALNEVAACLRRFGKVGEQLD